MFIWVGVQAFSLSAFAPDPSQVPTFRQQLCNIHLLNICRNDTHIIICHQRHVTRQKILNWKKSLKFPSRPRVSREGIDLMQQLLCEPEDRLGSQSSASASRPDALVVQARRSSFIPLHDVMGADGANLIKAISPFLLVQRYHLNPGSFRFTHGSGASTG